MNHSSTPRPACIGPDWLRCTDGYAFAVAPDPYLREDKSLHSPNPWERLVCITLRAQAGDFRDVGALLPIIEHGATVHLRDCAIRVFAQAAPSVLVVQLTDVLDHSDPDARIEAISSTVLTTDLRFAPALARHRNRLHRRFEREATMDALSSMLEPYVDDLELPDSTLDDEAFIQRVDRMLIAIQREHGPAAAIYRGAPVDPSGLVASIAELCAEDEPDLRGGAIDERFSILEGLTGWPYAGCLDDDCAPVLPKISHTLNSLRQSGRLDRFVPGQRYFFGHPLP